MSEDIAKEMISDTSTMTTGTSWVYMSYFNETVKESKRACTIALLFSVTQLWRVKGSGLYYCVVIFGDAIM